ncbi:MAG: 6-phosphogluconolactonase [Labilithrix sp.]|nr:6-phosphogluconolactonase [Labilithrix sp.]MCW5816630.1 6-phosphogluconolactonase [Labilithrix sp.]
MVTKVVPGVLIAAPTLEEVAREASARMTRAIHEAIKERAVATIALSGGSSPVLAYQLLAKQAIDWNKVHVYWVDERCVPPDHERSNYLLAKKALLDAIAIPPANVHRMRGEDDPGAAAAAYDEELRNTVASKVAGLPALDLLVMGVGDDGHTASLFPGDDAHTITDRLVAAIPEAKDKGREARLTLTVPVLENAKATVVIVTGKSKHEPLERIWATSGDVRQTPGRVIRDFRGSITWAIDKAAGGMT